MKFANNSKCTVHPIWNTICFDVKTMLEIYWNFSILKFQSTINEWKYVFLITAAIYFATGIAFVTFGSGQVQEWNNAKPKPEGIANDGMDCVECSEIKRH